MRDRSFSDKHYRFDLSYLSLFLLIGTFGVFIYALMLGEWFIAGIELGMCALLWKVDGRKQLAPIINRIKYIRHPQLRLTLDEDQLSMIKTFSAKGVLYGEYRDFGNWDYAFRNVNLWFQDNSSLIAFRLQHADEITFQGE